MARLTILLPLALIGAAFLAPPAHAAGPYGGYPPFVHPFGAASRAQVSSLALSSAVSAVAGSMRGRGVGAAGGVDAFVRMEDAERTTTVRFGTTDTDRATAVSGRNTRFAVAGWTTGSFAGRPNAGGRDGFVRVYSRGGALRWKRSFGTTGDDTVTGVSLLHDVVLVTGSTSGVFDGQTGSGASDAFVLGYSPGGTPLWTNQFGTDVDDAATGVTSDNWGPVAITGTSAGDLPGTDGFNAGGTDSFIARVDTVGGALSDVYQFGTPEDDVAVDVESIDPLYPYLVVGGTTAGTFPGNESAGGSDGFVAFFGETTGLERVVQFGTEADDALGGIAADAAFVYAAGSTAGTFPGEESGGGVDGFVAELDTSGDVVWTDQFGAWDDDIVTGVTTPRPSNINQWAYVAGSTSHAAFIGFRRLTTEATVQANLTAGLAVAKRWADDHGGSFAELTPVTATLSAPSFIWQSRTDSPVPTWITLADVRPNVIRLVSSSYPDGYFCLEAVDGVVTHGQSEVYDPDSCAGGW